MKDLRISSRNNVTTRIIASSPDIPGSAESRVVVFKLSDINFTSNQIKAKNEWVDGKYVSKLIVTEIQPNVIIDFVKKFKTLMNMVGNVKDDVDNRVFQPAIEKLRNAFNFTEYNNSDGRLENQLFGAPIELYKDLVVILSTLTF
jgi:hypothetical protein